MRKKWISLCMAGVMALGCAVGVFAEDPELTEVSNAEIEKVEISFSIGDDQISVNGEMVDYVAPYVVNDVTLVPVRLISESFGADVAWDEESQQATVTYGGVEIVLTIGSRIAQVDGEDVELLTAPEVTNDRTMLPLRFITETFGADVGWEEETQRVTVVKEVTNSNSIKDYALLLKRSNKEYVGDSYLGWSMKRSPEFQLAERSFDGYKNQFTSSGHDCSFALVIGKRAEDADVDSVYSSMKTLAENQSVIELKKGKTASGVEYANLQLKTKTAYMDLRSYIGTDKIYRLMSAVSIEEGLTEFNSLVEMLDTFDLSFQQTKAEDLSDVDSNNMHTFQSKEMEVSVLVPGDFVEYSYGSNSVNEFRFYKEYSESTSLNFFISVYSSEEGKDYQYWAEHDRVNNEKLLNLDYVSFSDLQTTTVAGLPAVYYTQEIKDESETTYDWDVFIDAGDYFYNISYDIVGTQAEAEAQSKIILDSVKIGTINKEKVGKMIRINEEEELRYKEYKDAKYSFAVSLPSDWMVEQEAGEIFAMENSGVYAFDIYAVLGDKNSASTREIGTSMMKDYQQQDDVELISTSLESAKVDKTQGYTFSYYDILKNGEKMRWDQWIVEKNNVYYFITFSSPDKYYGEKAQEIETAILESIDLK